ncbi:MAG: hypothetical protein GF411_19645 [Candidatus Lokiarchaeota archaeon]|nr:hypothetical protein [Candidatus Lokiarchaeota archaeon]
MDITFKCPECQGQTTIKLSDEEAESIKQRIKDEGRSPTMIANCENGHELLVTLYNQRGGKGLGVRDVVVPMKKKEEPKKRTGSKELDWLTDAFGGGD